TGSYVYLMCIESIVALTVALANALMILILLVGGRRLMKNHFYIVFANLIIFTSLKGFVELAFVLPYYIRQSSGVTQAMIYYHKCFNAPDHLLLPLNCLIYLSYFCALIIFRRRISRHDKSPRRSSTQIKLLKQSVVVFMLYAASILSVFALSFVDATSGISPFDISYAENLLNLSIAAVYPICFLSMSEEMRKVVPRSSDRVSSIGSNRNT
ncbi:hypothetical protein PMAYCL1PPCAC_15583, partial [Pristionchus mayeri]